MRIETAHLPEFGLDVSWAMCRNPMCANFGVYFEGTIPKDRKQTSDDRYYVRLIPGGRDRLVGVIECRYCGQSSRLASNKAIRPIARYFLSLSLPFADCPNTECQNHGVNLFERWDGHRPARERPYRRVDDHKARCRACGKSFWFGAPLGVMTKPPKEKRATGKGAEAPHGEKAKIREVRALWSSILDGVRTKRSVSDTIESEEGLPIANYYPYLENMGLRLHDYHCYRNARLLRADIANRDTAIRLYTDILEASLKADRSDRRHALLPFIVTTAIVKRTVYVVAAHPFFLPTAFCPDARALRRDYRRLDFETEWGGLLHESESDATMSTDEAVEAVPDIGRGGYFVKSPYAQVAHFLVVQKLLSRFRTMHNFMDGAKELYTASLVAYRERILAGRPGANAPDDKRKRNLPTAEVVVFQHQKDKNKQTAPVERPIGKEAKRAALSKAWNEAEERFGDHEMPKDLLKQASSTKDPRVRASLFRRAFKGGYSEVSKWAWLEFPPPSIAYRDPRTLWLTRMPGKTFSRHGKALLMQATLQPVDSIFDSIRARVLSMKRPGTTASGRGYRESYALPKVVMAELAVYLLMRNYALRRKTEQKIVPAEAMGLVTPGAARPNPLDIAWEFRLSITHAKRISGWLRS